jgi:hypothetical protein
LICLSSRQPSDIDRRQLPRPTYIMPRNKLESLPLMRQLHKPHSTRQRIALQPAPRLVWLLLSLYGRRPVDTP